MERNGMKGSPYIMGGFPYPPPDRQHMSLFLVDPQS
jgi:hypothetical protein